MRRNLCVAVFAMLLGTTAMAQTEAARAWDDKKPAWQWTNEERLAKRFDPIGRKARLTAQQTQLRKSSEIGRLTEEQIGQLQPTIHGAESPELFLPSELFLSLLIKAYPADGRRQQENRREIETRAAALGFGADLWPRLGRIVSNYLELRREADRISLAEHLGAPAVRRDSLAPEVLCQAKADALTAAKAEFGEELFLRFLYAAIAPEASAPESNTENLLRIEGGCR